MAGIKHGQIGNKELEQILAKTLVPVEPRSRFVKRLKARLVHYHGGTLFSGWMIIVVIATIVLVAVTMIRLFVRGLSSWGGLISNLSHKRHGSGEPNSMSA
jgi:hypothetical protein